jgi:hypothetical protein
MAPPFIAYFGALQNGDGGQALLQIAYDQIRLYREALFDANVSLWRHVAMGSWKDSGHWATGTQAVIFSCELLGKSRRLRFDTGNGWAAAGAMRVLATIKYSSFTSVMQSQQGNLTQWVDEILTGVWYYQVRYRNCGASQLRTHPRIARRYYPQQSNGTLLNYVDQSDSFADSASTALLAATTLRYSLITSDTKHDAAALRALELVWNSIDEDGWLLNTVNPEDWTTPISNGSHSPEGQSFVLLLAAAWAVY